MPNHSFDDFVNQQAGAAKEASVDWAKRLAEWKDDLASFYKQVESFLEKYIQDGKIEVHYENKEMHEETLGAYEVKALRLTIGRTIVRFDPIGTVLVGAKGRVDMIGPRGSVKMVLVDKDLTTPGLSIQVWIKGEPRPPRPTSKKAIEWAWKISTPPPKIIFKDLKAESFYSAMMEVVNG